MKNSLSAIVNITLTISSATCIVDRVEIKTESAVSSKVYRRFPWDTGGVLRAI
ncbi:MAG: hypothetical protein HN550_06100 [Deltaproteobacteria bacterium]|nr:hypothetical protein [Deltaproteobacteria bacterium]